ncbi:MAG: sugar-binding protein [Anaerolineales bacterium]|jgi:hypothetical protein
MLYFNRHKLTLMGSLIVLSLLACSLFSGNGDTTPSPGPPTTTSNIPGSSNQTPTPNLTLTAAFAPQLTFLAQTKAAATNAAMLPTNTPTATRTPTTMGQASPTLTPSITPTSTLIPITTLTPVYLDFSDESDSDEEDNFRQGQSVIVVFLGSPPTIDGDIGDWQLPLYAVETVVSGQAYYANKKDLSAEVKFGWDAQFLYIGTIVRDTKFIQEATGPQLWKGDSLEMLLDTELAEDFDDTVLSLDDFQLGISPGNLLDSPTPEAYMWAPRQMAGERTDLLIAGRLTDDGYMMEVAVPWSEFDLVPQTGQHFGFLFSVSDNDTADNNAQQSVVSLAPQRLLHDPTAWYDLLLGGP